MHEKLLTQEVKLPRSTDDPTAVEARVERDEPPKDLAAQATAVKPSIDLTSDAMARSGKIDNLKIDSCGEIFESPRGTASWN